MRIACIAVAVGRQPNMVGVEEILELDQTHDVVVFIDHATSAVDELAAANIPVHVGVKSYLEVPGLGVVLADAGQARSLAAMHAQDPFDVVVYDQQRCADLAWHQPIMADVPVAVRLTSNDLAPWQYPYALQQQGFVQAADAQVVSLDAVTDMGPRPVRPVGIDAVDDVLNGPVADHGGAATVRHVPQLAEVAPRIATLLASSPAQLVLGGRPHGPHGDADTAYLCGHVMGLAPTARATLDSVRQQGAVGPGGLARLLDQVVSDGGGALIVPVAAHGCDVRSFDVPLPPMAQAAREWVSTAPLHRRASAALPSRGGLVERGLYLAEAPAGVIAWCRQRPWAVRRLAGLPRPLALQRLEKRW